nr:cleavage and polyadenylation specificity factor subunit 2 [Coccidioides posadasii RMSCC 3488]
MNARIAYVDFAGLHDKRSLEMLIPLIQPRKLILIGGMKDETIALASECRSLLAANAGLDGATSKPGVDIFTPQLGDTVDASVDTNAWMVKLSRALVRRLRWQNVRSLGVVALTANLQGPDAATQNDDVEEPSKKKAMLQKGADIQGPNVVESRANETLIKKEVFPLLDVLPPNLAAATRSLSKPLHVGDLRLADLRKLMQASGHSAEFRGDGTLLIDGFVVVRKSGAGKIEIESSARAATVNPKASKGGEGTFLAVKRKIYDCLAVVARG